jgi:signal transduction histidine kinase
VEQQSSYQPKTAPLRGLGVGLFLSRHFARLHGGDLLLCPREGGPRGSQQLELEGRQGRQGLVSTMSISLDLDVLETVPLADQT